MKTILPIFWVVNILVFPKHNLNILFIKFHHVISAHGQCWSTTGHAAILVNMLTLRNKSLNFYIITFNSCVSYQSPCSVGNSHRSACPRPAILVEDWELFVHFSSAVCLWFEIQGMRTYDFSTEFQTLSPCNIPSQWYAGELGFVDMFIHACRFELESLRDRLPDTRGYIYICCC